MSHAPPNRPAPLDAWPARQPGNGSATIVLVLGICSLVFLGPIGFVLGLIALSFAERVPAEVARGIAAPSALDISRAGRTCAIIGVIIGSIGILLMCAWFTCVGSAILGGVLGGGAVPGGAPSP
ncbi:MAG: hypothetical protein AB7K52_07290 [Phycisphaerales bacterium]